jgi:hypothetical protein
LPHTHPTPTSDLQEVTTRNRTARQLIRAFSAATLTLADIWHHIETALDDTPALIAEITRLRAELAGLRRSRADLIAAARATLNAHQQGEPDPLFYLRDELTAQHAGNMRPGEAGW